MTATLRSAISGWAEQCHLSRARKLEELATEQKCVILSTHHLDLSDAASTFARADHVRQWCKQTPDANPCFSTLPVPAAQIGIWGTALGHVAAQHLPLCAGQASTATKNPGSIGLGICSTHRFSKWLLFSHRSLAPPHAVCKRVLEFAATPEAILAAAVPDSLLSARCLNVSAHRNGTGVTGCGTARYCDCLAMPGQHARQL